MSLHGVLADLHGHEPPRCGEPDRETSSRTRGTDELAEVYQETSSRTALALLDGNSAFHHGAVRAQASFDRFAGSARCARAGLRPRSDRGRFGHFDLYAKAGGGGIHTDGFDSLWVVDTSLTIGRRLRAGRRRLRLAIGQVPQLRRADIYDAGVELGIPITVLQPGAALRCAG
jgi:hypothetical protein